MSRTIGFIAGLLLLAASPAVAEDLTVEKERDIQKMLELTGALQVGSQFAEAVNRQMSEALKNLRPDVPERVFVILNEEIDSLMQQEMAPQGGLARQMLAIYDRHFSHEEIKGLLNFYQTELGRKTIEVLPQISQESLIAGQQWAQRVGSELSRRLHQRLQKEGIQLEP